MIYEVPIIETERLILKPATLEGIREVYEYNFMKLRNINGEFKFEKNDLDKLQGWEELDSETYDWIVYLKATNKAISNIVADRERKDIKAIELSYNTHPDYWKCGYTTEALEAVIKFLFSKGYDNLLCGYEEGNYKSKALGEKLGFIPYEENKNAWMKDNIPITNYTSILSREKYYELSSNKWIDKYNKM